MKNTTIILDAAHGEEVPGKRSPDGKFREYLWSRERIKELIFDLKALGYEVLESNPTTKEIGLSQRAAAVNAINRPKKIFLSLHVDAAGNGVD
jgi:N-acetylmuramoyl-L-alanine amidase